jgi:hypothetical protein
MGEDAGAGAVVAVLRSLQDSLRESTGLVRLDLQQHTALQVSVMSTRKAHCCCRALLAG